MTRLFLSLLSIGLLASSCKKKHTETSEEPKDEIAHNDFTPAKNISSVISYTNYYTSCTGLTPFPGDSSVSFDLDINSDQVADFQFTASHWPYTGSTYCGHCYSHDYKIIIKALSPGDSLAVQSSFPGAKIFKESAVVDQDNTWTSSIPLRYQQCTMSWYFSKGYIGVKVGTSFGYIHIDRTANNGVLILDYGINKTENRSITCGQK